MSKTKTEEPQNNRRDIELPPNAAGQVPPEAVEPSEAEKILEATRPYWAQIALAVCVLLLGYVLINSFLQNSRNSAASSWQQLDIALNQFRVNQNVDSLKQVALDFPNDKASNWALQIAGDYELNRGLQQLALDREGGMKLINRAKESFEQVVAAPNTSKTTMQQRRSLFTLAYAHESLGEFDKAKELYEKYIEVAPDSVLLDSAERGLKRVTDPDFKSLYNEFAEFKPFDEEAPGADVPDAPNIDFPEIDIPAAMDETKTDADTGGDFAPATEKPETELAAEPMADPNADSTEETAGEAAAPMTEEAQPAVEETELSEGNPEEAASSEAKVEEATTETTTEEMKTDGEQTEEATAADPVIEDAAVKVDEIDTPAVVEEVKETVEAGE